MEQIMMGNPVKKNCLNVILHPCCSAIAAATKLQLAPIRVPFPPKHAPNANLK